LDEKSDNTKKKDSPPWVPAFLSFILPGFGQFYNRDYFLGTTLVILEFLINGKSRANLSIYYSFNARFAESLEIIDWQWLLFYPSLLTFAVWHAYYRAGGRERFIFVGFILCGSLGLYWSLFGSPIAGGLLGMAVGSAIGLFIDRRQGK